MENFNLYANYYDLFYNQKDYSGEVTYLNELITQFADRSFETLLDLGCGTGKHANLLSQLGYHVDGVDISPSMIQLATKNYGQNTRLKFYEGDITSFSTGIKYDAVLSLFHVVSYQNSNEDLLATFVNAAAHVKDDGLFIFDFWYGPGVLTDLPKVREKSLSNEDIDVVRTATPVIHSYRNVVDVNYEVRLKGKNQSKWEEIYETHSMRYFFKPELEFYLLSSGLEIVGFYHWLTQDEPNLDSWNAVVIAKKIKP